MSTRPADEDNARLRALIVRSGGLGDLLLLRDAIASLKAASYRVTLLAPQRHAAALLGDGPGDVDECWDLEGSGFSALYTSAPFDAELDGLEGFSLAIAYSRSTEVAASLKRRVPVVCALDPTPPHGVAAARWYTRPLDDLGLAVQKAKTAIANDDEIQACRSLRERLPGGFLALHPGSGSPSKNWPIARFSELIAGRENPQPWLLITGPAEEQLGRPFASDNRMVLARNLPLRALGALLASCGLYIGNDSGISHLAAAWGAPCLLLFGPTDPAVWASDDARTIILRAPRGRMEDLSFEEVQAGVARAMGRAP
ncbi:MAG: glycosyltransferase family 9 protein [Vicinamibacteria bacterium]|jgi:ADP-heptose:LPS heptosyltransferase|nr:glycosyltransferase family 9 protein [Vicinamibacteria bacterium]